VKIVDDVPQPIVDHVVLQGARTHAVAEARFLEVVGRGAHVLHSAGHHHVGIADLHGLGGQHDGLEGRAADLVHGDGLHLPGHLRQDGRLFSGVLAVTTGEHMAHDDLVHRGFIDPGPPNGLFDHYGAQLRGANTGQRAVEAAESRPYGADDYNFSHSYDSFQGA